ncbi:MAG: hypothetical protein KFF77_07665 [Bacteroidetes bacterium]|nr:hypothetical protein [Bacteroidota bacterium]
MSTNVYRVVLCLSLAFILTLSSCSESGSPTDPKEPTVETVFNSTGEGQLQSADGAEVRMHRGAISTASDGSNAQLTVSITSSLATTVVSTPIPSMYEVVGSVQLFEPANFVFTDPVQIFMPTGGADSPEDFTILWYDSKKTQWVPLPLNTLDEENKRLGASVFELGYFVAAKITTAGAGKKGSGSDRVGGLRYNHTHTDNYYYTLTINAVTYANPAIGWPNLVGYSSSTGEKLGGTGPRSSTSMGNIPRGSYTVYVSRVKRGTLSNPPGERETYTVPTVVEVGSFTNVFRWSMEDWSGWTTLGLGGGGQWKKGTPQTWPSATVPLSPGADPLDGRWTVTIKNTSPVNETNTSLIRMKVKSPTVVTLYVFDENGDPRHDYDYALERSADKRSFKISMTDPDDDFWVVLDLAFVDVGMSRIEGTYHERLYNNDNTWEDHYGEFIGVRELGIVGTTSGSTSLTKSLFGHSAQRWTRRLAN